MEVVVLCVLVLPLRGLPSLRAVVRALRLGDVAGVPALRVSPQAFAQRLVALPHTAFLRLLTHAVTALRPDAVADPARARLAPFAAALVGIDDTTLDAVARKSDAFPHVATGSSAGLGGRVGAAVDLVTGLMRGRLRHRRGGNERHRLLPLVAALPAGSLVVFDLGYFAFGLFDALGERYTFFVTRMKGRVERRTVHTWVDAPDYRDRIVWLGGEGEHRADALAGAPGGGARERRGVVVRHQRLGPGDAARDARGADLRGALEPGAHLRGARARARPARAARLPRQRHPDPALGDAAAVPGARRPARGRGARQGLGAGRGLVADADGGDRVIRASPPERAAAGVADRARRTSTCASRAPSGASASSSAAPFTTTCRPRARRCRSTRSDLSACAAPIASPRASGPGPPRRSAPSSFATSFWRRR